jgi:hypothetical protein
MSWKAVLANAFPRIRDIRRARAYYRGQFGRNPRFFFPKTFNEKVCRRKILDRDPRMPVRTDKVFVKKFVEDKLGSEWVIPTLWHGPILPPLKQRNWPVPFVLKANHGSGMNMFVRSLDDLDWPKIEHICRQWMGIVYGEDRSEWAYFKQLLVEPFIGECLTLPVDYKFLVFRGTAEFVQVDIGREHNHTRVIFDREWHKMPFTTTFPMETANFERPASLSQMIDAAEKLSDGMSFVRVDLYEIAIWRTHFLSKLGRRNI